MRDIVLIAKRKKETKKKRRKKQVGKHAGISKPNLKPAIWIMAVIVVLDQLTKILIILNVPLFAESYKSIPILGDTLMLTHVRTQGQPSACLWAVQLKQNLFIAASIIINGHDHLYASLCHSQAHVWAMDLYWWSPLVI
jgi:lipoprotein signal peptidase